MACEYLRKKTGFFFCFSLGCLSHYSVIIAINRFTIMAHPIALFLFLLAQQRDLLQMTLANGPKSTLDYPLFFRFFTSYLITRKLIQTSDTFYHASLIY